MLKRALISVSKKDGIIEFARGLANLGVEIVSTGGTARAIREADIAVKDISDLTGFPEILDGRVKTLHPKVHGGLLGIRDNPNHQRQMAEQQINPIDLVVVNLYPFEETAAKPGIEFDEVIENIDIGGPSMIRSAAKNFRDVGVVVDPADYDWVLEELKQNPSGLSLESRFQAGSQGLQSHRRLRCCHRFSLVPAPARSWEVRVEGGLSSETAPVVGQGQRSALRRESASACRLLSGELRFCNGAR